MTAEIPIFTYKYQNKFRVDAEFFDEFRVFKWRVEKNGKYLYPRGPMGKAHIYFITSVLGLEVPSNCCVKAKDGDYFNITRENIEIVPKCLKTRANSQQNKTSRFVGVCAVGNRFYAQYKGKRIGSFATEEEAGQAYNRALEEDLEQQGLTEHYERFANKM